MTKEIDLTPVNSLSATDAGFVSGVTVTDFCRTYRHRLFRWPEHLARFRRDCNACYIRLEPSDEELTATAERLVARTTTTLSPSTDVALISFATPGPLGYLLGESPNGPPTLGMHVVPLAAGRYRRFFAEGATLAVAGVNPFAGGSIVPAEVKHRNRLAWWLAEQAIGDPRDTRYCPGAIAVLTDHFGRVADTALGSIVAVHGNDLIRPPVGRVLQSISLGVLSELSGRLGLRFVERDQTIFDLATADELLLVGSGFGVAGVRRLIAAETERVYPWPGPLTRRLIAAWSELVGLAIDLQFVD